MANGFEKFEKLFSLKRKGSEPNTAALAAATGGATDRLADMQFPSPSFIRPKTSRMAAREEVHVRGAGAKSISPTSLEPTQKYASVDANHAESLTASRFWRENRPRSASLDRQRSRQIFTSLEDFSFPKPPSQCGSNSPPPPEYTAKPLPEVPVESVSDHSHLSGFGSTISTISRLHTPPSESESELYPLKRPEASKLPSLRCKLLPTPETSPEASPEVGPVPDWLLLRDQTIDILNEGLCDDIQRKLLESTATAAQPWINSSHHLMGVELPSPHSSFSSSSLQEPGVGEFFNLSDDNVAETYVEEDMYADTLQSSRDSVTLAPSVLSLPLRDPPLLTLEPPSTSRPAQAAAFEAARIASRYKFDMLYVVNLWPETVTQAGSSESDHQGMTGRLLAAYGLHRGPSPFQISAEVHMKVLQSTGWMEYRDEYAQSDEFAAAYACAFFPDCDEERRFSGSTQTCDKDRGLVFAAYRKKNPDGTTHYSNAEELASLSLDVEAMVEMLIDIHVTNQLRHAARLQMKYLDETGPMPSI